MMAMDNYFLFTHQPSLDWDLHTFGVEHDLHDHMHMSLEYLDSPMSSEASTGYLQDAVAEWSDRCKRRRVESSSSFDPMPDELEDLLQGFWNSNCHEDPWANLSYKDTITLSDEQLNSSLSIMPSKEADKQVETFSPSPSQHQENASKDLDKKCTKPSHPCSTLQRLPIKEKEEGSEYSKKKKKKAMGLVYPFAVVKPGGLEGDVTLADINERILMRPARPVRHPVGEYACVPCAATNGPGLSGKAIVGFTRIHTQGRGTITIIRTRE